MSGRNWKATLPLLALLMVSLAVTACADATGPTESSGFQAAAETLKPSVFPHVVTGS